MNENIKFKMKPWITPGLRTSISNKNKPFTNNTSGTKMIISMANIRNIEIN